MSTKPFPNPRDERCVDTPRLYLYKVYLDVYINSNTKTYGTPGQQSGYYIGAQGGTGIWMPPFPGDMRGQVRAEEENESYSSAVRDSQSFFRKSAAIPHNSGNQSGIRKTGLAYVHAPDRTANASPEGPTTNATK